MKRAFAHQKSPVVARQEQLLDEAAELPVRPHPALIHFFVPSAILAAVPVIRLSSTAERIQKSSPKIVLPRVVGPHGTVSFSTHFYRPGQHTVGHRLYEKVLSPNTSETSSQTER